MDRSAFGIGLRRQHCPVVTLPIAGLHRDDDFKATIHIGNGGVPGPIDQIGRSLNIQFLAGIAVEDEAEIISAAIGRFEAEHRGRIHAGRLGKSIIHRTRPPASKRAWARAKRRPLANWSKPPTRRTAAPSSICNWPAPISRPVTPRSCCAPGKPSWTRCKRAAGTAAPRCRRWRSHRATRAPCKRDQ